MCTPVITLTVEGGGIVRLEENLQQFLEGHHHRVFEVPQPLGVPDDDLEQARDILPEVYAGRKDPAAAMKELADKYR